MSTTKRIDIHGLTVLETKDYLTKILNVTDDTVLELQIIHGYIAGQVLQQYVRKQFQHPRIRKKLLTLNKGETIYLLNRKE